MSACTAQRQKPRSDENRNPGEGRRKLDSCLRRVDGQRNDNGYRSSLSESVLVKRAIQSILLTVVTGIIISCGLTTKEILTKSRSVKSDIYTEVEDQERTPPKGLVDLVVKTSIKTHVEGYYVFESSESPHGKPGYPIVFNIDGQGTLWKINGEKETTPDYNKDGKRDPEGGEGIRYTIEKRLRVKPGSHTIFFALPEDRISVELQISLDEGRTHVLEFRPLYSRRPRFPRSFVYGVSRFEVFLDGAGVR